MFSSQRPPSLARRLKASRWPLVAAGLCVLALFLLLPSGPGRPLIVRLRSPSAARASTMAGGAAAPRRVLVELFVMSRCPDARFCVAEWSAIHDKLPALVSLRAEAIAQESADGQLACMHGASECLGNKALLCLQEQVAAARAPIDLVNGLHCLMAGAPADAAHLNACMASTGVPEHLQARVSACVNGTEGNALALASARVVQSRNVTKSCTVYVNGEKRCIRDGGRWYDCPGGSGRADFIRSVCDAHKAAGGADDPQCVVAQDGGGGGGTRRL